MKKTILTLLISMIAISSSATIINIPADYPTIQQGIDASSDGDTVLVQPGTYYENINFNGHNIVLGSLFLTTGDTSYIEQTVIDGDSAGSVVTFESGEDNTAVVTGLSIINGNSMYGGGIYCNDSYPTISDNIIDNNRAMSSGGGIYSSNFTIFPNTRQKITHNRISGNTADLRGGGICFWNNARNSTSFNLIRNNVASIGGGIYAKVSHYLSLERDIIAYNQSLVGGGVFCRSANLYVFNSIGTNNLASLIGGGLYIVCDNNAIVMNSILWADSAGSEISEIIDHNGNSVNAAYSDIDGGWSGYQILNADPLLRNPDGGDFHLMAIECGFDTNSPCIDNGWFEEVDSLLDCSWGLGSVSCDIGVYGGGNYAIGVQDDTEPIPNSISLLQNYPNPFNAQTTVRFILQESQYVTLTIYDLLGRWVETLIDEYRQAGVHMVTFDASDISSGVYFYRLEAGEYDFKMKMLLIK